jgi:hypothetical protein
VRIRADSTQKPQKLRNAETAEEHPSIWKFSAALAVPSAASALNLLDQHEVCSISMKSARSA